MARYVIRRLWPSLAPQYVIVEVLKNYGYEDFSVKGDIAIEKDEAIRDISEEVEEVTG